MTEKCFKRIRKYKIKDLAAGDSDKQWTERTPSKCFICGSEDCLTAKYPNPPKNNDKWQKKVRFGEGGNCAPQKECINGDNNNDKKIYAYMPWRSGND